MMRSSHRVALRAEERGWIPAHPRKRNVTAALRAYASMTTSASLGAVRKI